MTSDPYPHTNSHPRKNALPRTAICDLLQCRFPVLAQPSSPLERQFLEEIGCAALDLENLPSAFVPVENTRQALDAQGQGAAALVVFSKNSESPSDILGAVETPLILCGLPFESRAIVKALGAGVSGVFLESKINHIELLPNLLKEASMLWTLYYAEEEKSLSSPVCYLAEFERQEKEQRAADIYTQLQKERQKLQLLWRSGETHDSVQEFDLQVGVCVGVYEEFLQVRF